ncbi:MAG: ATP-binding cassette domain-containing protein, partial [Woeseiaceae bacterium]|nr:ATP-binding cassette domain-containing protein [Woeseiaceae bacterium]
TILIAGQDVTTVDPADRDLSMVFQNYALFPHMTCRANLEFPLKTEGVKKAEVSRRVEAAGRLLRIESILDRKPAELSGGQRQRVAIGRAIVKEPKVFLFDEPLSNLDAALRIKMRVEITKLHRQLQNTIIYVTHDQVEAMTMADRIVVLRDGRIEQVGTPHELYFHPANQFVATFIGAPQMNLLPCQAVENEVGKTTSIRVGQDTMATLPIPASEPRDGPLTLGFRPEHVEFEQPEGDFVKLTLRTDVIENLGAVTNVHGQVLTSASDEVDVTVSNNSQAVFEGHKSIPIWIAVENCHLFTTDGTALPRDVEPPSWK